MNRRYLYLLIFSVPATLVAAAVGQAVAVMLAGRGGQGAIVGNDVWSVVADPQQLSAVLLSFLVVLFGLLAQAFRLGRQQEQNRYLNLVHVAASILISTTLIALIMAYQWHAGGFPTETERRSCADICYDHGYSGSDTLPSGSGTPTCTCYGTVDKESPDQGDTKAGPG